MEENHQNLAQNFQAVVQSHPFLRIDCSSVVQIGDADRKAAAADDDFAEGQKV